MIRYMILGFVDHDAAQKHQLVVRKPLDDKEIKTLLQETGEASITKDSYSIAGVSLLWRQGYLAFPVPVINDKAIDAICHLARQTGCDIVDLELGQLMSPDSFRAHCQVMADLLRQTPDPFKLAQKGD